MLSRDVADQYQYSTIARYRGHGISTLFHTAPYISHCRTSSRSTSQTDHTTTTLLQPGMIFTIEPMFVNAPHVGNDCYEWEEDHWTVSCMNTNLLSCQFEHTVYINDETGVEILTRPTKHHHPQMNSSSRVLNPNQPLETTTTTTTIHQGKEKKDVNDDPSLSHPTTTNRRSSRMIQPPWDATYY
jgi:Metallopeptidase family M24